MWFSSEFESVTCWPWLESVAPSPFWSEFESSAFTRWVFWCTLESLSPSSLSSECDAPPPVTALFVSGPLSSSSASSSSSPPPGPELSSSLALPVAAMAFPIRP